MLYMWGRKEIRAIRRKYEVFGIEERVKYFRGVKEERFKWQCAKNEQLG